jgi:hypothetical protein
MENTPAPQTTAGANVIQMPLAKKTRLRAEDKWSPQVMKLGFTPLPNLLLRAQGKLKLSPVMLNVLVQLAEHWWEADKNPFPAKDRIATRMGKSPRQVQRYITQLEKGGFVTRIQRFSGRKAQTSNEYSLAGLVAKLKALEPEFTKAKELKKLKAKKLEKAS